MIRKLRVRGFAVVAGALALAGGVLVGGDAVAAGTVNVSGNTSAGENQPGWMFNRDANTDTPFVFDNEAASIGAGSLHVLPIGAIAADKFIGEFFMVSPLAEVESISYDFKIGTSGADTDEEQFYMNVYANFGISADTKFYDCRYNIVPASGSTANFTTVVFDPTVAYPVTTRVGADGSPFPCPAIPADMETVSPGATLRVFALNVGDTSTSDVGLDGYIDNVVVALTGDTTTYDLDPTPQCTTVCYVDDGGSDANGGTSVADAKQTIQAALNTVQAGGQVRVLPGSYDESAPGSMPASIASTYQFGLFFHASKPGITLMGVTAGDAVITDASLTEATITTNATNNFGFSGVFVEAEDTTIQGLTIGNNVPGNNKTVEVVADGFSLRDVRTAVTNGGAIYISDFAPIVNVVESYTITENLFDDGTQVAISSGAGEAGPVAGRLITNNVFAMGGATYPGVSFNGAGGVPWYTQPVGGAIITGNNFSGSSQYIRARGTYLEDEFDWQSYWDDNTYDKAVVALVTEAPFNVRSFSYTSAPYTFTNVRRIGAVIQPEVDNAIAGDTILVKAGTYPEHVAVNKSLTLKGANAGVAGNAARSAESIVDGTDTSAPFQVSGNDVTIDGFRVVNGSNGLGAGIHTSPLNSGTQIINNLISGNAIGIYANCLADCLIEGNLFAANNKPGSAGGTGIYSEFTNGLTVNQNEFRSHTENNPVLFAAVSSAAHVGLVFSNNWLHDNVSGVYALSVDDGLFVHNDISAAGGTGLTFDGGSDGVVVQFNLFHDSARGVRVRDLLYGFGPNTDITVNRNSITGNGDQGILVGASGHNGTLDATCNWYGSASGPSGDAPGTGDSVSGDLDFLPWLTAASPLETAPCLGGVDAVVHVSGRVEGKGKPSITLAGDLVIVDGQITGSLSVNYKTLNKTCFYSGDANTSADISNGVLTMTNLTNSCAGGEFTIVLENNESAPKRGAISITGPDADYNVIGALTQGNIEF